MPLQSSISNFRYLRFRLSLGVWHSVWFRYLALWAATYPKSAVFLAVTGLMAIFSRSVAAALRWLWHLWSLNPSWSSLTKAAAGLFLVWLFAWAIKVRKRIFVAPFEDYSGDSALKDFVTGLAPMLLNELSRIRKLHENADESGAYSSGDHALNASISVQSVGETLESAVTKESTVDLGVLRIPIGAMLGIFGRVVQGPKLSGSVHKQGNVVTLIAHIEGGGLPNTDWRMDSRDVGSEDSAGNTPALTQLVEQLAYRIFTDLVPTGSTRWEAVYAFSRGLKHLRITTRTATDRPWNLRQAEAAFIEAVANDNKFGTCYYNLGVVYEGLDQPDSAKQAYLQAIRQKSEFAPSYYALAVNCLNAAKISDRELYADCIRFCDQAIALNPSYARAWDAKGLACRKLREAELGRGLKSGEESRVFKRSTRNRKIAAAVSWRDLCRSVLAGDRDKNEGAKRIAVQCLRSLAVGYAMLREAKSFELFDQALYLRPGEAEIHFEFGKVLFSLGRYKAALRELTAAVSIDAKPLYWAWLAGAQTRTHDDAAVVRESLRRFLVNSGDDPAIRASADDSLGDAGPTAIEQKLLKKMDKAKAIVAGIGPTEEEKKAPSEYVKRMEEKLPEADRKGWDFSSVIKVVQASIPDEELKELVGSAADLLVRDTGLYGTLAYGYMGRKEPVSALPHAERAVILNPTGAWERSVLGQVYWDLSDYERAEAEWKTCLDLSPTDQDILNNVALTYWNRGVFLLQPDRRREMFERVIEYFQRVLKISENQILDSADPQKREAQLRARGNAHFCLGRFHQELLRFDDAFAELMKAKGLGYKPLESSLHLGDSYLEARAYDKAEDAFREGLKDVCRLRAKAKKENKPLLLSNPAPAAAGEDMPVSELMARLYFGRAIACASAGVNLDKARRLGQRGNRWVDQVAASKYKELKASYHLILGSIALKSGKVDLAVQELEHSIRLYFEKDCCLRLAEAYLERARKDKENWEKWVGKARDSWQSAKAADVRGRCTSDLALLQAGMEAIEQEKSKDLEGHQPKRAVKKQQR
jgi:tetratricopeptide (TPR) repeat protein